MNAKRGFFLRRCFEASEAADAAEAHRQNDTPYIGDAQCCVTPWQRDVTPVTQKRDKP